MIKNIAKGWICADCFGEVEIKGYSSKYFQCIECGCKNAVVRKQVNNGNK